jgi:hypothetical protein
MHDEEAEILEWAKQSAAAIDAAVEEANTILKAGDKIQMFWGRENVPGYECGSDCPDDFPGQVGLLTYRDENIACIIWPRGHSSLRTHCDRIRFVMDLRKPRILASEPSELLTIFESCPCVGLVTEPALEGPIPGAVGVSGVATEIPVDGMSGGGLLDTLFILRRGYMTVEQTLRGQMTVADFMPEDA